MKQQMHREALKQEEHQLQYIKLKSLDTKVLLRLQAAITALQLHHRQQCMGLNAL